LRPLWNETGTPANGLAEVSALLRYAGLDFKVTENGLYYFTDGIISGENAHPAGITATVIEDLGRVVDIDRKGPILQNQEAFNFLEGMDLPPVAAGMMDGMTWVLTKWELEGIDSDLDYMVLFINDYAQVKGHMFGLADGIIVNVGYLGKGSSFVVNNRTPDEIYGYVATYFSALEHIVSDMRSTYIVEGEVLHFFDQIMYPGFQPKTTTIRDSAHLAILCELQGKDLTKWNVLLAYYKYMDHERRTRGDSDRFQRALFEPSAPKQKLFALLYDAE
jgi:hypothetical protein